MSEILQAGGDRIALVQDSFYLNKYAGSLETLTNEQKEIAEMVLLDPLSFLQKNTQSSTSDVYTELLDKCFPKKERDEKEFAEILSQAEKAYEDYKSSDPAVNMELESAFTAYFICEKMMKNQASIPFSKEKLKQINNLMAISKHTMIHNTQEEMIMGATTMMFIKKELCLE